MDNRPYAVFKLPNAHWTFPYLSELINAALIFAELIVTDRGLDLKEFCGTNLDIMAKSILERTVSDVGNSNSVIMDETSDIARIERVALCLSFILNGQKREPFIQARTQGGPLGARAPLIIESSDFVPP